MCLSGSLRLVRLALFALSPPSPDSSLGMMTATTRMPQQLQVQPTHFPYSPAGRKWAPALKASKPLFSHKSLDKDPRPSEGMKWRKQMGEQASWIVGELIRRLCLQGGRSPEGGDAFSHGTQQMKWSTSLIFQLNSSKVLEGIGSTRPCNADKKSLFTVAIETGIEFLSVLWWSLWYPFSGWEIRQLNNSSEAKHGPKTST